MQGVLEFLKTLGASHIAAMGAVTVALVGVLAFFIPRVTAPRMTPLFTDLAFEDSAAVVLVEEKLGVTMTEIIKVERA